MSTPRLGLQSPDDGAEVLFGECAKNGIEAYVHPAHDHDSRGPRMRCLGWPLHPAEAPGWNGSREVGAEGSPVEPEHSFMWLWEKMTADLAEWSQDRYVDETAAAFPNWEEAAGYMIPTVCKVLGPAERFALLAGRMFKGERLTEDFVKTIQAAHAELERALHGNFGADPKEGR